MLFCHQHLYTTLCSSLYTKFIIYYVETYILFFIFMMIENYPWPVFCRTFWFSIWTARWLNSIWTPRNKKPSELKWNVFHHEYFLLMFDGSCVELFVCHYCFFQTRFLWNFHSENVIVYSFHANLYRNSFESAFDCRKHAFWWILRW